MLSEILNIQLNQDSTCFSVSLNNGYKIYNTFPLKNHVSLHYPDGIQCTSMLYRSNYLALVGGGKRPQFPANKVLLWDDFKQKFILELEFKSEVKNVVLRRDRIIVVLLEKIFVYSFSSQPQLLCCFETGENPNGLVSVCHLASNRLCVYPGKQPGHVHLVDLSSQSEPAVKSTSQSTATTLSSSPPVMIPSYIPIPAQQGASTQIVENQQMHTFQTAILPAHTSQLQALCLNQNGTLLATCSVKGTLIRVFDTKTGKLIRELRRGTEYATIWNLDFSHDSQFLLCGSDKGTIHVFKLNEEQQHSFVSSQEELQNPSELGNRHSSLAFMKDLLPKYFSSEWSFAFCHVSGHQRFLSCFDQEQKSIIVIGIEGSYYVFSFDSIKGGECKREIYHRFLQEEDEESDAEE